MQNSSEVTEVISVHLVVSSHYQFKQDAPELFEWNRVINPKVASIAQSLTQAIKTRQELWVDKGVDPVIYGLREALRLIAQVAVWSVQSEQRARTHEENRIGLHHARSLPKPGHAA